ncbi:hypothetical protein bcgnr5372_26850 [Bacillus luti]|nr:hypothetical protein [Bacillus cereus]HDR8331424.1 hypothetical protein [Bacillus cereus]HDR8336597.1 hypothetical protein [Bacillus cereus]
MWKQIQLDENLYEGTTPDGYHYRDIRIEGCKNPNEPWTYEDLAVVTGVLQGQDVKISIKYKTKTLKENEQFNKCIEEAKDILNNDLGLLCRALEFYKEHEEGHSVPTQKTGDNSACLNMESGDLKISITGPTKIPFWKHDLKIEAAIALLETVDFKDFAENNEADLFFDKMEELQELLNSLRL